MARRKRGESARTSSPVKLYLNWSSTDKAVVFYDKEKKENVPLKNLSFTVLNIFYTVAGYNQTHKKGIRGTEVRDVRTEEIQTYIGGKAGPSGLWGDLKNTVEGIKFAIAIYIAPIGKSGIPSTISKLTLSGGAAGAYFDFINGRGDSEGKGVAENELYEHVISIGKGLQKKHGGITYHVPTFEAKDLEDDVREASDKLFEKLDDYLIARGSPQKSEPQVIEVVEEIPVEEFDDLVPQSKEVVEEIPVEEFEDDLPF